MLEQLARRAAPPRVHLFFGARARDGLYDLESLRKMAAEMPWLTVVPAVSDEPVPAHLGPEREPGDVEHGPVPDVVARWGSWTEHDAYVCGPPSMVTGTVERLTRLGLAPDRIRLETFAEAQR